MFELSKEQLRTEAIVKARMADVEAAVYTEDSKRISAAQELAVEAFRDQLDAKVAQMQYGLKCVRET